MEPRFGWDFSEVRVHANAEAASSAQALQARAYTVGDNIIFGRDEFRPESESGRRLLAHELAHTIQPQQSPEDVNAIGYLHDFDGASSGRRGIASDENAECAGRLVRFASAPRRQRPSPNASILVPKKRSKSS